MALRRKSPSSMRRLSTIKFRIPCYSDSRMTIRLSVERMTNLNIKTNNSKNKLSSMGEH